MNRQQGANEHPDPLCMCPACESVFVREACFPNVAGTICQRYCPWDGHELRGLAGNVFGIYRLEAVIGAEGSAVLYRGSPVGEPEKKKTVTILCPNPDLTRPEIERFMEEHSSPHGTALGETGPSVPGVDGPHRAPWPHVATDRADGPVPVDSEAPTLKEVIKRKGRLSAGEARSCLRGTLRGLRAVHAADRLHGDLRPGVIRLREGDVRAGRDTPVVLDPGLAIAPGEAEIGSAPAGPDGAVRPADVFAYMAPEKFDGRVDLPRSDYYSFGVIAYELLTGEYPFVKPSDTEGLSPQRVFQAWRQVHHFQVPRSFPTKPHAVPRRLRALCRACLSKDPKRRPRDERRVISFLRDPLSRRQGTFRLVLVAAAVVLAAVVAGRFLAEAPVGTLRLAGAGAKPLGQLGLRGLVHERLTEKGFTHEENHLAVEFWAGQDRTRMLALDLVQENGNDGAIQALEPWYEHIAASVADDFRPPELTFSHELIRDQPGSSRRKGTLRVGVASSGDVLGWAAYRLSCRYTGGEGRRRTEPLYLVVHCDPVLPRIGEIEFRSTGDDRSFTTVLNGRGERAVVNVVWDACRIRAEAKDERDGGWGDVESLRLVCGERPATSFTAATPTGDHRYELSLAEVGRPPGEKAGFSLEAEDKAGNKTTCRVELAIEPDDSPMFETPQVEAVPCREAPETHDMVVLSPRFSGTVGSIEPAVVEYRTPRGWKEWKRGDAIDVEGQRDFALRFALIRLRTRFTIQHAIVGSKVSVFNVVPWRSPRTVDLALTFLKPGDAQALPSLRVGNFYQIVAGGAGEVAVSVGGTFGGAGDRQIPNHWIRRVTWDWMGRSTSQDPLVPFTLAGCGQGHARLRVSAGFVRTSFMRTREFDLFVCRNSLEETGVALAPLGGQRPPERIGASGETWIETELAAWRGLIPREREERLGRALAGARVIYRLDAPKGNEVYRLRAGDGRVISVRAQQVTLAESRATLRPVRPITEGGETRWSGEWEIELKPHGTLMDGSFLAVAVADGFATTGVVCLFGRSDAEKE